MTAEERLEKLEEIQGQAGAAYRLILSGELDAERGRIAVDLLQLLTELVDLEDALARKTKK